MTTSTHQAELLASFERQLARTVAARYLGTAPVEEAIRYVLAGGGKRVRPLLCMLSAESLKGAATTAMPGAIALEFVHTYSLVHDDLPCMDDDDLRRGRPTAHKVHGEAHALLAGDALLTDAFALLSDEGDAFGLTSKLQATERLALVRELATAAGGVGMVSGQSLDLHWTARRGASRADLDGIHLKKTGYLLGAAAAMGAISAGAKSDVVDRFREFGRHLGLAFQIRDDLLDDTAATGKTQGKDRAAGKLTYLALMAPADAEKAARQHSDAALGHLAGLGETAGLLALTDALLSRTS